MKANSSVTGPYDRLHENKKAVYSFKVGKFYIY